MSELSGNGKSILLEKLFKDYPGCFALSVSHTTRKPRPGEKDGVGCFGTASPPATRWAWLLLASAS
ncbi:unnamed protein product [Lymnaea stagnalis]|uniref:Guanylate kinase-like domain-containing protein n=1 Tax=Lymnaea stagnalis TaxID=6523 RepID=A0AAV2ITI0_LYMST